jgi:hypothetical protein
VCVASSKGHGFLPAIARPTEMVSLRQRYPFPSDSCAARLALSMYSHPPLTCISPTAAAIVSVQKTSRNCNRTEAQEQCLGRQSVHNDPESVNGNTAWLQGFPPSKPSLVYRVTHCPPISHTIVWERSGPRCASTRRTRHRASRASLPPPSWPCSSAPMRAGTRAEGASRSTSQLQGQRQGVLGRRRMGAACTDTCLW